MKEFLDQFESVKVSLPGVRLPEFTVEKRWKDKAGAKDDCSNYEFLRTLCIKGFKDLGLKKGTSGYDDYGKRVKYELEIINELGFVDYILLVWDVINYCNENSIPTGLGRGSAAGSLVLYLIGVTKIDPLKHGLYFERFISKIRAKKTIVDGITYLDGSLMCDIDLDICYYNRQKVLQYLEEKFKGKTSKILTFNTLSSKLVIKECGKIIGGKSEEEMGHVADMVPKLFGKVADLSKAAADVDDLKDWGKQNKEILETALKLEGLIKNKGVHPSGIQLSYYPLNDICPTELTSDGELVSSYDMEGVSLFNVKLDALGLRGVSVVDGVCKMLGKDVRDIDLDNVVIYQQLQDLKYPHGLFQIEADLAFRTCQKVKPRNLGELSAVLALARPGAMQFIDQFAKYTNTDTYEVIHPFFEDILKETGGIAAYQEQLMKMAHKIGFTLDEAELLRRIVGKKKVEEMGKWEAMVYEKCKENKIPEEVGKILWGIMDASKDYSFNKSHSVSYAALAAITIYLKFVYPREFFLSLLRMTKNEPNPIHEISVIHKEMDAFHIKLLPPNILKSQMDFEIEGNDIRFGLTSIKGISDKGMEKLSQFKVNQPNKLKLFQAAKDAGLNIGIFSALIQAGALGDFGKSRVRTVYEAQIWNILTDREKLIAFEVADRYDYDVVRIVKALSGEIKTDKGKAEIKPSRLETIRSRTESFKAIYSQNILCERFANWWYENLLCGYTSGVRLIDIFKEKKDDLIDLNEVKETSSDMEVSFIGVISEEPKSGTSKNKNRYYRYQITDEVGAVKCMLFETGGRIEYCKQINGVLPKKGDIVIVEGKKKDGDTIFASLIAVQQNKIYTKFSQMDDKAKAAVKSSPI